VAATAVGERSSPVCFNTWMSLNRHPFQPRYNCTHDISDGRHSREANPSGASTASSSGGGSSGGDNSAGGSTSRSGSIRSGGASSSSSDSSDGSDVNGGDSAKGERSPAVAGPAGGSCAPSLSVLPWDRRFNLASATWGVPWRAVAQKYDSGGFTAEPFVLPAGVEGRFPWFQGGALPSYIEVRGGARIRACVCCVARF
jgi:hypothetical protein